MRRAVGAREKLLSSSICAMNIALIIALNLRRAVGARENAFQFSIFNFQFAR
jgi:hypothetical protein